MNAFEQKIVAESSEAWISSQQQIYLDAKIKFSNRESDGIFFIGNLFDNSEEPIYIDWCHIGPNGNEIVAKAIIERLHGQL